MRAALVAAVALAGLVAAGEAWAQDLRPFYDGNVLHQYCDAENLLDKQACVGFIAGISEATGGNYAGYRACIPRTITTGQMRDVVVKLLQAHPEDRHLRAVELVARALADAWPCR